MHQTLSLSMANTIGDHLLILEHLCFFLSEYLSPLAVVLLSGIYQVGEASTNIELVANDEVMVISHWK